MPALTNRLYRRAGPIALTPPRPDLPSFEPPDRRIRPRRPNRSSSLESSDESNELVSVSDESLVSDGSRLARRPPFFFLRTSPCDPPLPPFFPPGESPGEPSMPRTRPSSSNCDSNPVSPYSHSITPAKSSCCVWKDPSSRNPCLDATRRIVPFARSRSAIARDRSSSHRPHLHTNPHTLASCVRRIVSGSHRSDVPYDTVISSPRSMCLSEYSVTRSSLTDTAALGRQLWLHVLTRASSRAA
mmetsp:Transcript_6508/g.29373  ORF Transcript_6508/g.29373 Transcript_6508/m.29373 type:complete len:243 (-) Transcript_6508:658-1386(-)